MITFQIIKCYKKCGEQRKRGGYYLLSFKSGVTKSSKVAEGVREATMLIYKSLTGKLCYLAAVLVQAGHGALQALKPGGVQEFA